MKKKLAMALMVAVTMGVTGTAFADSNPFLDVPANHWSYNAVSQLAKDGIVDGFNGQNFQGDKTMTRYEMAQVVAKALGKMDKADAEDKALVQKLYTEYQSELNGMNVRVSALESDVKSIKDQVGNVKLSGFIRTKYDSDRVNDSNANSGNKHTYMDLQGTMKVNDQWNGHFESEMYKNYTNHSWSNGTSGAQGNDSDTNGTIQKVWAAGQIGNVSATVGRKWWGFGQNVIIGHSGDGIKLDVPIGKTTASIFNIRLSQANYTTKALADFENTSLYGLQLQGDVMPNLNVGLMLGGNTNSSDSGVISLGWPTYDSFKEVNKWGAIALSYRFANDFTFLADFTKTNADKYNTSQEYRLNYKWADINTPGSYQLYARYFKFQRQGDICHDDEWNTLAADAKGWVIGGDYVLAKNIIWTNFYSEQTINLSGPTWNQAQNSKRKLFRTQFDFHF